MRKDFSGSLRELQQSIALDPARTESYAALGSTYLAAGQPEQAEAAFQRAVRLAPDSLPARIALAEFYYAQANGPANIRSV